MLGRELEAEVAKAYAAHKPAGSAGGMSTCTCGWTDDGGSLTVEGHIVFKIALQVGQWLDRDSRVAVVKK